jgi:hypothetical protein
VAARFPHNLSGQVPWREVQAGVYDCTWGTDVVRVVVAGQLPREPHNAPLHLFSASPELVGFGQGAYRPRSGETSLLLGRLFEKLRGEGFAVSFTMEDFKRQLFKEHFGKLTTQERREILQSLPAEERREILQSLPREEQQEVLQSLPPEVLLGALSQEQIREYLDRQSSGRPPKPRKSRRKG